MSSPSAKEIVSAFTTILRDQLKDGQTVEVPGLGTFSVEHQPSEVVEDEAGNRQMRPPRNSVTFDPDA
jgi:nucleoid DNA-binding protein